MAGGGIPAIAALVSIPLMISLLGYESFVVISLIVSLTIFFFVYDFGMSRTMTFLVPDIDHKGGLKDSGLIGSAFLMSFLIGILTTSAIYFISPYIAVYWINIGDEMRKEAVSAFQISAFGILPAVISHVFRGVLEGQSNFRHANICKIFSGASIFLAPLLALSLNRESLVDISLAIVCTRYFSLLLYIIFTTGLTISFVPRLRLDHISAIWKYAKWAALSGFVSTIFVYGDRFFVAGYLKPEDLTLYIASQDILIRYLLIPWSMALVLMPIFSAKSTASSETLDLYQKQQRWILLISFAILLLLLLIVFLLVRVITSLNIPDIVLNVVFIQIVGIFFCSISQLPLIYLYAKGQPKLVAFIYISEMLIYVLVAPYIFSNFGLIGACLIWSGRLILEYFLLRHFVNRQIRCN